MSYLEVTANFLLLCTGSIVINGYEYFLTIFFLDRYGNFTITSPVVGNIHTKNPLPLLAEHLNSFYCRDTHVFTLSHYSENY